MKTLRLILFALVLVGLAPVATVKADLSRERLDNLFERLKDTIFPFEAAAIEGLIWNILTHRGVTVIDQNMTLGILTASIEETKNGVRVKEVKTKHGRRQIDLPNIAVEFLKRHKAKETEKWFRLGLGRDDDAYVFTTEECLMRKPDTITSGFTKLAKKLDLGITFHDLRHTHISQLLADSHPITTVSRRAGHAKVSITLDIYGHTMPDSQKTMMSEFGAAFETAIEQAKNKAS